MFTVASVMAAGPQAWPADIATTLSTSTSKVALSAELNRAAEAIADLGPQTDLRRKVRMLGLTDGLVLPIVVVQPDHPRLDGVWQRYLKDHVLPQGFTHYGLAVRDDRFALVFTRRLVRLEPPSGLIQAGQNIRIKGILQADLKRLRVVVGRPDERVDEGRVVVHQGELRIDIALDGGDGVYIAEVMGHGSRGTEVLALLPIAVGVDKESPAMYADRSGELEVDHTQPPVEQLLSLINADRARLGLGTLRHEARLSSTASSHAQALAGQGVAAHVVAGGDTALERVAKADISTPTFHENVAMAPSIAQVHADLWMSPSHRQALLDPRVNAIGLGIEVVHTGSGALYFVVEHLAQL